jgi:Flp pilus assembly protein TadG
MLKSLDTYLRRDDGAVAAEFAMFLILLVPLLVNIIDIGAYVFQRMQVDNAAQAASQAAWANCTSRPIGTQTLDDHCPNLAPAVTGAIASTTLGEAVTLSNTIATDAQTYCPDPANQDLVASTAATCDATGSPPGYYVKVTVSYPFQPIFAGATIASAFTTPLTATTWTRIE